MLSILDVRNTSFSLPHLRGVGGAGGYLEICAKYLSVMYAICMYEFCFVLVMFAHTCI